jgi:hypothetical protein
MADNDAWGDLFAMAADVGSSSPQITAADDGNSERIMDAGGDAAGGKQRNKKRKRKQNQKSSGEESFSTVAFEEMLQNRIVRMIRPTNTTITAEWPEWLHLTGPILQTKKDNKKCHKWAPAENAVSSTETYKGCANCGTSALNHRVEVVRVEGDDARSSWPFLAFGELRNLRCAASLVARKYQSQRVSSSFIQCSLEQGSDTLVFIESITKSISSGSDDLSAMKPLVWRETPEAEARILESKLNDVIRYSTLLLNSFSQKKNVNEGQNESSSSKVFHGYWEPAVRLIIACDALYYRMYYLQLVRMLPVVKMKGKQSFLPHPSEYFGLPCLTLDSKNLESQLRNHIASLMSADPETGNRSASKEESSWLEEFTTQYGKGSPYREEHPLAIIHQLRQIETVMLFQASGWVISPKTEELTLKSLKTFTDKEYVHETPAPDVLMQWRDGCRDFLCNLYAYATLSSEEIDHVSSVLLEADFGVIEIGAGTGYIAKLLKDRRVVVDAWDVHPTSNCSTDQASTMNEYHGNTPSFITVKKCSKLPEVEYATKALLLCYPPPGSPMAHDTLQMYLRNGGRHVIHMGEFKGLTGDARFESLLVREMSCHSRRPCLTWGTDASQVTIWTKDGSLPLIAGANSKLLLPCSHCAGQEGKRRCRLLRSVVYCSNKCFEDDAILRSRKLRMQWINMKSDALMFTNPQHFAAV